MDVLLYAEEDDKDSRKLIEEALNSYVEEKLQKCENGENKL